MAFIKKENSPSVIIFKGRVIMLKTGFTIKNNTASAIPPIIYVLTPPFIVKPVIICDVKKRLTE